MCRAAVRAIAAGTVVLLLGSPLPAYLVRRTEGGDDIRWNLAAPAPNVVAGKVTFFVDEASANDVTGQQFADAVRASVQSWEDSATSVIAFQEDPARSSTAKNASDRINRFGYSPGSLQNFVFASAYTAIQGSRIVDVDVVFNPDMPWSVETPGNPQKADVQAVAAHEWGHAIGLDHVPLKHSTMYYSADYGQLSLRSLATDDRAGAARSYPAPGLDETHGRIRGRVDVDGTSNDRGIQVTAIDFVTGLPAAASITDSAGDYEILGLPPGVYRVVASPMGTATVEGGVYSPYWNSAVTTILPAVRGHDGAQDGSTEALVLAVGDVLDGIDLAVAATTDPGEPNETIGAARPTALGRSVAGRIDGDNDHDVYSFAGTAKRTVSIFVHAGQIGSGLDPRVYLRGPAGLLLAVNDDISTGYLSVAGSDTDARILEFTLPTTGTYFVEIEPVSSVQPDDPADFFPEDFFYVLTLLEGGAGAASPYTSEIWTSPAVVPADGVSTSVVTFRPRTLQATGIRGEKAVTFELAADGNPDGSASAMTDHGDGTWSITLTAPAAPGSDVVRAKVDGAEISTATVNWRGPADFAASEFLASPRRVRSDGVSTSVLTLVPRDENGLPVGPGRPVSLSLGGDPAAALGPTSDEGDGSYSAVLTAGLVEEDLAVNAVVEGSGLGDSWFAAVGFPLGPVVDGAAADLAAALASDPPPPAKAAPKLAKARDLLAASEGLAPFTVVTAVQKALKQLEAAGKKGSDTGALATELAEAVREAARDAVDAAGPLADTAAEQGFLATGEGLLAGGDALLDGGSRSKAAAKYRSALRLALRVR